jgi:hypothetical protein
VAGLLEKWKKGGCNSFAADTEVWTPEGRVAIGRITVGHPSSTVKRPVAPPSPIESTS